MEQGEFLARVLFFKRVMKCQKDHRCMGCGATIPMGSTYFYSLDPDPETGYFIKICVSCFDHRLERPSQRITEQGLDR